MRKSGWRKLSVLMAAVAGTAYAEQTVELPDTTNIVVAANETLRIEYLRGGTTLYKSGEGRLEVAVVGNTNLNVVVSNGTFAVVRPATLDLSGDSSVVFHLDANRASSLTTYAGAGGTNFISGVADADGRVDRSLSTLTGRPDAYLSKMSASGLPAIDLGSLHNTVSNGYGAALAFDSTIATAYEILYVFEDDPDAKNRSHSVGPCFCAPAASGWDLLRGYVENGTSAPILPTGTGVGGRVQDGNYVDGVKRGATDYGDGKYYNSWPVPDGTHVLRRKINTTASAAFGDIEGLGYYSKNNSYLSYGGLKIGEVIFLNTTTGYDTISDTVSLYQDYLMSKWLDVATVGKVTLMNDSVLDLSGAPLKAQLQWAGDDATMTGAENLRARGYYEAGNPAVAVSGSYVVPEGQTQLPGMAFTGDAVLATPDDAFVARLEGTGTLRKTGAGTLTVGAHDSGLTALSVEEGELRISPLEASGSFLHVDASAEDTLTYAAGESSAVSRWTDVENGANWLNAASVPYAWDNSRKTGSPFVSEQTQNGLPLMDFGPYTTKLHPDGTGGAFIMSTSPYDSGANIPGVRNFFAVWGDYDDVKNLASNVVDGVDKGLVGPALYGGPGNYGRRGFGGGGASFPLLYSSCPARYNYSWGQHKIDGVSVDHKTYRPGSGMHVLDQKIGDTGVSVDYIGGIRWCPAYEGGAGSGVDTGVWGGLRMGEILIYRNAIPEWFRSRISQALRRKWFNVAYTNEYSSVAVAKDASLCLPSACIAADSLTIGGTMSVDRVETPSITVTADATVNGVLAMPSVAALTFEGDGNGSFPTLCADELSLDGELALTLDLDVADAKEYVGTHRLVAGTAADFENVVLQRPVLPAGARSLGIRASAEVRSDGIYCTLTGPGLTIIFR